MALSEHHTNTTQQKVLFHQWFYLRCFQYRNNGWKILRPYCFRNQYLMSASWSWLPAIWLSNNNLFGHGAWFYGTEYQFTYKNVAIDDDVPCAICKVTPATTTMMVPAKLTCPQNWTLQYHSYLGASYYLDQASEFICIDNDPEYIEGSRQLNNNGLLIYPWQIEWKLLALPKIQYWPVFTLCCLFFLRVRLLSSYVIPVRVFKTIKAVLYQTPVIQFHFIRCTWQFQSCLWYDLLIILTLQSKELFVNSS